MGAECLLTDPYRCWTLSSGPTFLKKSTSHMLNIIAETVEYIQAVPLGEDRWEVVLGVCWTLSMHSSLMISPTSLFWG